MFNPRWFFQKITIFSHKSHGFPQKTTIFLPANITIFWCLPPVFPGAVHVPRRLLQVITTEPAAVRTTSAVESASSNSLVLLENGGWVGFIWFLCALGILYGVCMCLRCFVNSNIGFRCFRFYITWISIGFSGLKRSWWCDKVGSLDGMWML